MPLVLFLFIHSTHRLVCQADFWCEKTPSPTIDEGVIFSLAYPKLYRLIRAVRNLDKGNPLIERARRHRACIQLVQNFTSVFMDTVDSDVLFGQTFYRLAVSTRNGHNRIHGTDSSLLRGLCRFCHDVGLSFMLSMIRISHR
jgi:hypothetical protein